jgi:hypothetical protein
MNAILGIGFILIGVFLLATPTWSAELHERWNQKLPWTRWATGPKAMRASKIANVLVGLGLVALGLASLTLM